MDEISEWDYLSDEMQEEIISLQRENKLLKRKIINGDLVEIDINKKYALLVKDKLSDPEYYELLHRIEIFLKSDKPIMVIDGSRVELIDLSENE